MEVVFLEAWVQKEEGLRASRTEGESAPSGRLRGLEALPGWNLPCLVGTGIGRSGFPVPQLVWETTCTHRVLSLSSLTLHHGPFTSSGPIAYFLPRLSLAHPQNVLGVPTSSLCSPIYPTLMLLFSALSAAALPRPLFSPSAPRKAGGPIAILLNLFSSPHPTLPTPVAFFHLPMCACVSLAVWEFPDWGQGSSPSLADLGQTWPGPQ